MPIANLYYSKTTGTDTPMFSIIIPCYESLPYIKKLFDTLSKQTFRDFEAIFCIDGGDKDTLNGIYKHLELSKVAGAILYSDEKLGPAESRNSGIDHAKGKIIAFLDHDDYWTPDKLSIIETKHLQAAGVYCHLERWTNSSKSVNFDYDTPFKIYQRYRSCPIRGLIRSNILSTSAVSIDRVVLGDLRFDKSAQPAEDYKLWLKLASKSSFTIVNMVLGTYQLVSGSMSDRKVSVALAHSKILFQLSPAFIKKIGFIALLDIGVSIVRIWRWVIKNGR